MSKPTYADYIASKQSQLDLDLQAGRLFTEEAAVIRQKLDALAMNATAEKNRVGITWGRQ